MARSSKNPHQRLEGKPLAIMLLEKIEAIRDKEAEDHIYLIREAIEERRAKLDPDVFSRRPVKIR
jgi:hypothetical protein